MAVLGCGFDPGVISVYCAYAQERLFDTIEYIDIIDCNAGDHGKAFATNFNPEINLRSLFGSGMDVAGVAEVVAGFVIAMFLLALAWNELKRRSALAYRFTQILLGSAFLFEFMVRDF